MKPSSRFGLLLAPLVVLSLVAPALADKTAAQLTADRLDAIKRVLDFDDIAQRHGVAISDEERYRWSVRLVDAQLDDPAQAKTALADHAKRMGELRDRDHVGYDVGRVGMGEVAAADFYKAEADLWVLRGHR